MPRKPAMQRMTYSTAAVLQALDSGCRYGFDIIDAVGVRSGTVYPLLRRLEDAGLVEAHWESATSARERQRPPRRFYELTPAANPFLERARARFPLATPEALGDGRA